MNRSFFRFLAVAALAATIAVPAQAADNDWQWSLTPYLWGSNLGLDVSINDQDAVEKTMNVGNLLDKLDFAFEVNVQAQKGRHGLWLDASYYNLGDDDVVRPLAGHAGSEIVADGDLRLLLADFGGLYNPRGDGRGFAVLYGVRMLDTDQKIKVRIDTPLGSTPTRTYNSGNTGFDALLGVRWVSALSDRWLFNFRADASTGDSEYTWSGLAGVGYTYGASDQYALLAGYRYLKIDLKEKDAHAEVESRLEMYGPYVGFRFVF